MSVSACLRQLPTVGEKSAKMSRMKITLPKGWFARILLGRWVLLMLGIALAFVTGVLAPRAIDLVTPLWILSIFVVLGTFAYIAVFAFRRFCYYLSELRNDANFASTIGPLERVLVAGWVLYCGGSWKPASFSVQMGSNFRSGNSPLHFRTSFRPHCTPLMYSFDV